MKPHYEFRVKSWSRTAEWTGTPPGIPVIYELDTAMDRLYWYHDVGLYSAAELYFVGADGHEEYIDGYEHRLRPWH